MSEQKEQKHGHVERIACALESIQGALWEIVDHFNRNDGDFVDEGFEEDVPESICRVFDVCPSVEEQDEMAEDVAGTLMDAIRKDIYD